MVQVLRIVNLVANIHSSHRSMQSKLRDCHRYTVFVIDKWWPCLLFLFLADAFRKGNPIVFAFSFYWSDPLWWLLFGSPSLRFIFCPDQLFHQHRFERKYDPVPLLDLMSEHPLVPLVAVLVYGLLIVWGQHYMSTRPAWNWRKAMAMWNLSLSLFSWFGMFRTLPHLLHNLYYMSFRDNLCMDPRTTYGSGSTGLWVQLFILSKFP